MARLSDYLHQVSFEPITPDLLEVYADRDVLCPDICRREYNMKSFGNLLYTDGSTLNMLYDTSRFKPLKAKDITQVNESCFLSALVQTPFFASIAKRIVMEVVDRSVNQYDPIVKESGKKLMQRIEEMDCNTETDIFNVSGLYLERKKCKGDGGDGNGPNKFSSYEVMFKFGNSAKITPLSSNTGDDDDVATTSTKMTARGSKNMRVVDPCRSKATRPTFHSSLVKTGTQLVSFANVSFKGNFCLTEGELQNVKSQMKSRGCSAVGANSLRQIESARYVMGTTCRFGQYGNLKFLKLQLIYLIVQCAYMYNCMINEKDNPLYADVRPNGKFDVTTFAHLFTYEVRKLFYGQNDNVGRKLKLSDEMGSSLYNKHVSNVSIYAYNSDSGLAANGVQEHNKELLQKESKNVDAGTLERIHSFGDLLRQHKRVYKPLQIMYHPAITHGKPNVRVPHTIRESMGNKQDSFTPTDATNLSLKIICYGSKEFKKNIVVSSLIDSVETVYWKMLFEKPVAPVDTSFADTFNERDMLKMVRAAAAELDGNLEEACSVLGIELDHYTMLTYEHDQNNGADEQQEQRSICDNLSGFEQPPFKRIKIE